MINVYFLVLKFFLLCHKSSRCGGFLKEVKEKKTQLLSPCAIVSHVHIRQNTASACLLYLIGNLIYTHPPLFLCNLCGMLTKGRGLPQYTQLYVTSRSIKMLPRFPLYLPFPFSLSVHLSLSLFLIHMCSAANTSNAVSLCYLHPCHLPSHPFLSFPPSLSLPRCTGDVILFQLDSPPFSLPPLALALSSVPH